MIGRTNAGGGSGGGLNFKVVGGTSAPASPKENTIWVNTDTAIPSWHFGVDEPNFYNLKTRTEGDAHTIMAPHKVSAGDILNFKIPKKVLVTREAICIRCPETGKSYYVRNGNGTAAGSWSAGTTVGVLLSNTSMPIGSYGSGSGTALIRAWEKCYHTEGTLWIQSGASSPVAFNALKKNGITVYPISAKQYVSGAWADKTAKSYQGGAWVDWYNGELYKGGNQYENITGGWKKSALTWSGLPTNGSISYGEYLTVKANSGGYYDATTVNKLDLTEYSQLRYDIASDSATDDSIVVIHQKESGAIWSSTPYWTASSNDGILPLTGISGLYYISVLAMNNKTIKVGNIRLVK